MPFPAHVCRGRLFLVSLPFGALLPSPKRQASTGHLMNSIEWAGAESQFPPVSSISIGRRLSLVDHLIHVLGKLHALELLLGQEELKAGSCIEQGRRLAHADLQHMCATSQILNQCRGYGHRGLSGF